MGQRVTTSSNAIRALAALLVVSGHGPTPGFGAEALRFREVSEAWGLNFRHHHGGSGQRYMVETMVGGVVVFDFDGDGDEDLYFVDGGDLPGYEGEPSQSRLFRNENAGLFIDVTSKSRITGPDYGSGGTAGDIDNDGDLDLYLTAFGSNVLYRNRGDGTFEEIAKAAGVDENRWSTSAAFADVDRDGDLDLYVAGYTDFTVAGNKECRTGDLVGYCQPNAYHPVPDTFYRNLGNGVFEEATSSAGMGDVAPGAGLGVAFGDLDRDRWPDLYVANDQFSNRYFHNSGDGTFVDLSLLAGNGFGDSGEPEAGMGVDMGDVDGDRQLDIVVTNFESETNALYRNLGGNLFMDSRWVSEVAEASFRHLAFGVDLGDFDNDGDLDLVVANGHINDNAAEILAGSSYPQRNQVFENLGEGRFQLVEVGLDVVRVSRGLATADLDDDGDLDLVIVNSNDRAEVYENLALVDRSWLLVDLRGRESNRYGIDSWIEVHPGRPPLVRYVRTASSYLSQGALSAHFGLDDSAMVEDLRIDWPSGRRQSWRNLPVNRHLQIWE